MPKRGLVARLYDAVTAFRGKSGEAVLSRLVGGYGGSAGMGAWQFERAEQVRHYRHWVYSCVKFLSKQVAKKPPRVAAVARPGEREKHFLQTKAHLFGRAAFPPSDRRFVPPHVLKSASPQVAPGEDLEYLPESHPLCELLANPNEPDTWATFWREAAVYFYLTGVSYTWKVYGDNGRVSELWNIPAHWVQPVNDGGDRLVSYYLVRSFGGSGAPAVRFDPDELIEVKDPHPVNKLAAQSPLQANAEVVDQFEKVQQARYWSLVNGANVGAVVQLERGMEDPNADALQRFENEFLAKTQGTGNFNRPIILPPGTSLVRFDAAAELAFIQSADQLRDYVVTQLYGLSRTVLGTPDGVPWATFVGEMRRVLQEVVSPDLALFGGVFTERLANEFDPSYRVFWELPSPQDDSQRLAEWSTGLANGCVAPNEYRTTILALEPLPEPEYDRPMSPAGMVPGGGPDGDGFGGLSEAFGEGGDFGGDADPDSPEADFKGWAVKVRDDEGHDHDSSGRFTGSGSGGTGGGDHPALAHYAAASPAARDAIESAASNVADPKNRKRTPTPEQLAELLGRYPAGSKEAMKVRRAAADQLVSVWQYVTASQWAKDFTDEDREAVTETMQALLPDLSPVGEPGREVRFNGRYHDGPAGVFTGDLVRIVHSGWVIDESDSGNDEAEYVALKADVRPVGKAAKIRDEQGHEHDDRGRFTGTGGGRGRSGKPKPERGGTPDKPPKGKPGSQLPAGVADKLKAAGMVGSLPPADVPLKDIKFADLSKGPEALKYTALMSWNQTTKSGRTSAQYRYTQAFHDRNAAEKHERVAAIDPHIGKIKAGLEAKMGDASLPQRQREAAAIANAIRETGLRPTDSDESVKHGHFGISSIQARHCTAKGNEIHLDFTGKEGVRNQTIIREPANVAFIKGALKGAKGEEFVFREANSGDAGDALKEASKAAGGPADIKVKDLRTLKAHQIARAEVERYDGPPPPLSGDKKKDAKAVAKAILEMAGKVSAVLNNKPEESRDTYVHPKIWESWQRKILAA